MTPAAPRCSVVSLMRPAVAMLLELNEPSENEKDSAMPPPALVSPTLVRTRQPRPSGPTAYALYAGSILLVKKKSSSPPVIFPVPSAVKLPTRDGQTWVVSSKAYWPLRKDSLPEPMLHASAPLEFVRTALTPTVFVGSSTEVANTLTRGLAGVAAGAV